MIDDDIIYGGSLSLNGRPLALGLGYTTANSWSLWISVGRPIGQGAILERGVLR